MRVEELFENEAPLLLDLVRDAFEAGRTIYVNWKGDGGKLVAVNVYDGDEVTFVAKHGETAVPLTFTFRELEQLDFYPGERMTSHGKTEKVFYLRKRREA